MILMKINYKIRGQRKSFLWDSAEPASKSDACDLKEEKLCDLSALAEHYRCFWSDCKQLISAHSSHEKDLKKTHEMSVHLHDELHHYLDALRHWNREKCSDSKDLSELTAFINSIFLLYYRITRFLQQ